MDARNLMLVRELRDLSTTCRSFSAVASYLPLAI
jgi:hypothetical protein